MATWKPIPGHDGYEASDEGQVRSVDRWRRFGKGEKLRLYKGQPLKICFNNNGYGQVTLGRKTGQHVHHLVAFAFIGPRPTTPTRLDVRHKNGNKSDNRLDNLCYGTRKQNEADKKAHGTSPKGRRYIRARWLENAQDT